MKNETREGFVFPYIASKNKKFILRIAHQLTENNIKNFLFPGDELWELCIYKKDYNSAEECLDLAKFQEEYSKFVWSSAGLRNKVKNRKQQTKKLKVDVSFDTPLNFDPGITGFLGLFVLSITSFLPVLLFSDIIVTIADLTPLASSKGFEHILINSYFIIKAVFNLGLIPIALSGGWYMFHEKGKGVKITKAFLLSLFLSQLFLTLYIICFYYNRHIAGYITTRIILYSSYALTGLLYLKFSKKVDYVYDIEKNRIT